MLREMQRIRGHAAVRVLGVLRVSHADVAARGCLDWHFVAGSRVMDRGRGFMYGMFRKRKNANFFALACDPLASIRFSLGRGPISAHTGFWCGTYQASTTVRRVD